MSKYHVTIEDCIDEEDVKQQRLRSSGFAVLDMNRVQNSNMEQESRGNKRQAWDEMDAMEEQARSEKLQSQSTAKANALQAARIIKQAQQSSDY